MKGEGYLFLELFVYGLFHALATQWRLAPIHFVGFFAAASLKVAEKQFDFRILWASRCAAAQRSNSKGQRRRRQDACC